MHRFNGSMIFAAEIQCDDGATYGVKLGLAVKAALASWANLSGANLSEANLSWANLSGADLSEANLRAIKHDIWGIIAHAIPEVPALRKALIEGKVNGSTYSGACACLCGTIANTRGVSPYGMEGIQTNASSLAERFFYAIREGDTPETSQPAKLALQWIDEFMALIGKGEAA